MRADPTLSIVADRPPESAARAPWASRLRAFVASGPAALPDPSTLFWPDAAQVTDVLLPLVARRTLKRLLLASLRLRADGALRDAWDRLIAATLELPDDALAAWLVRPEVTGLVAGVEDSPDHAEVLVLFLGQFVVDVVAAHGGDLPPTRVARSTPGTLILPSAATIGALDRFGHAPLVATVRAGPVTLTDVGVAWRPLPSFAGGVGVSTGRDAWLLRAFPGIEHVAELDDAAAFTGALEDAAQALCAVWPEAHAETLALLRWVVPLAGGDSWYVPGMHGLVALGVRSGRRQVRDLFHETCHHKLSRVLELASAATNPRDLVFSPFARGKQPVTSLLQSCWSFAREYELIRRLKASGAIDPAAIAAEERKFRVFFDKGIPVLRRDAKLTALGDAVLTRIEEAVR